MHDTQPPHIEKLKKQQQIIKNRILQAEARHKTTEKKRDTRRKILLGAYYLDKFRQEGNLDSIKPQLDQFLKRNSDRVLFDLPLIEVRQNSEEPA